MLLLILFASAFAQEYRSVGSYEFTARGDASTACTNEGLQLCSAEQLFTVVYGSESYSNAVLCYTGWLSNDSGNYQAGFFNNDANTCSGQAGWSNWAPGGTNFGAHCCTPDVPETNIDVCSDLDCGEGYDAVDGSANVFCASGSCNRDTCCNEIPAEADSRYVLLPGAFQYVYGSAEDAEAACQTAHPDYHLCTYDQIVGLSEDGEQVCSPGWYEDVAGTFDRGYYLAEHWATTDPSFCDVDTQGTGERLWVPADSMGTAHCCTESYVKSDTGDLSENSLAGATAWCADQTYANTVCTGAQIETIANIEDPNQCKSNWYRANDEDTVGVVGWFQGTTECDGNTGLQTWAHPTPGAHCCADYVYEPELGDFTATPEFYSSGFVSGGAAAAECTGMGYDQLCTKGQLIHIGTNVQTDLCTVGWVENGGSYEAGFYQTTNANPGCGNQGAWNNGWIPSTPVAFCCMAGVPAESVVTDAYYNGDWDYSYNSAGEASAMCTGDYSLCTRDQVYTVATVGAERSDGSIQVEDSICRLGWTAESDQLWYQGAETDCGETGWRSFASPGATYHCCTNFAAVSSETTTTTAAVSEELLAFKFVPGPTTQYEFASKEQAAAACINANADYRLCSAAEIVQVAVTGAPGDDDFIAVDPQTELCASAWVDSDRSTCNDPHIVGWYRALPGCGSAGFSWQSWAPTDGSGNTLAGAFCCGPSVVIDDENSYREELGCPFETTNPPTKSPVVLIYYPINDATCAGLNVNDCSRVYTKDNQYFVSDDGGDNYYSTCVAYSAVESATCDHSSFVCAGTLRNYYGSYEQQGVLLAQAMAEPDYAHSACPPMPCAAYSGYSPDDFSSMVSYCVHEGCYYMNGMDTCVCDGESSDVDADLQNVWENTFDISQCEDTRTFDEVMTDQLYITNQMITDLETQVESIPDVSSQLSDAQGELEAIWNTWESDITSTVGAAIATAEAENNPDLAAELQGILDSLAALGA